ncbi:methionine synthase [Dysosmobacter sp.]|uniref:methionine synthase n=1 Tax=Dysosmobacter sp. TaxID=2591382 RepID=UPI002A97675F|nr:methionine synthase [Dysosmobacter sp.]MDY5612299.1 methionine synthase [Dysosmobacter sp.]
MELNIDEALRYLGVGRQAPPELRQETEDTARRLTARLRPRYTYRVFSLKQKDGVLRLPEADLILPGKDAKKMLADCGWVVLLGCTLGAEFEGMLRAEQARDMAKAVILDACGSAWVEAGCDQAEQEIAARLPGQYLTDRFSPGYGDLPLSLQPAICGALDLGRRLGVHVSERFLMNPSKSVTALIGIADHPQMARIRGCAYCAMRETCTLRKGGKHCGN